MSVTTTHAPGPKAATRLAVSVAAAAGKALIAPFKAARHTSVFRNTNRPTKEPRPTPRSTS